MSGSFNPAYPGSGQTPAVSDPLTDAEMVDVRRFCGYPAYGTGTNSDFVFRFSVTYVELEYHIRALSDPELAVVRSKLADLTTLDAAIPAAGANSDTDQAAVWKHNPREIQDRQRLFTMRRRDLCEFIGIPAGPSLQRAGNSVTFIV